MTAVIWIVGPLITLLVLACAMIGGLFLWSAIHDEIYQRRASERREEFMALAELVSDVPTSFLAGDPSRPISRKAGLR